VIIALHRKKENREKRREKTQMNLESKKKLKKKKRKEKKKGQEIFPSRRKGKNPKMVHTRNMADLGSGYRKKREKKARRKRKNVP